MHVTHCRSLLLLLSIAVGVPAAGCDSEYAADSEASESEGEDEGEGENESDAEAIASDDAIDADVLSDSPGATLSPDGSGEFVGRRGGEFYVGNKPFRHVGANIGLAYMPKWQVLQELDFLRDAGVKQVRVSLPNDAMIPAQMIARLKWIVDEAYYGGSPRRYIRVTVALGGNYGTELWHWEKCTQANGAPVPNCSAPRNAMGKDARANEYFGGDRGFYTRAVPGSGLTMLNDSWIDWGFGAWYKPYAKEIVAAFKDHPGIFAWDIVNEVNSSGDPWVVGRLADFYKHMAAEIRAIDPNHLITTGMISTSWASMQDVHRDAVYNDPNIDYLTVHVYDGPHIDGHEHENGNQQIDDIWRANNRYNKPVVVEEFGMSGADAFQRVQNYYSARYAGDPAFQVDAIVHWGVTSNESGVDWGTGDTPFSPKSQNMIRPYQALWGRWAGQLDDRLPLIIDNDAQFNNAGRANFSASGAWTSSTYSGQRWGTNYRTATTNNGATGEDGATYSFKLDAPACKAIDARWNANSGRSNTVPFVAYNASNQHLGTAYKNQQIDGDRWNHVGTWCFTAGWNRVTLSRWSSAPGAIIADAIRVRPG